MTGPSARIEQAFFRKVLPVVAELETPAGDEEQIKASAHALAATCAGLFAMGHLGLLTKSTRSTPECLATLKKNLERVAKNLREMPEKGFEQIDDVSDRVGWHEIDDIWEFQDTVADLARIVELAHRQVVSGPKPPMPKKPTKVDARVIAEEARTVYEKLTGEPATLRVRSNVEGHSAYGPFHDFVDALFKALDVDANAEYFARMVTSGSTPARKKA